MPSTLNETYDSILLRIDPSYWELAKTALRWITVAQQPLTAEELVEACTVKFDAGGLAPKESKLTPTQIALLLRHFVIIETGETTTDHSSPAAYNRDYVAFAHFSVKEYLTIPDCMASTVRSSFAIELKQAHFEVARSCIVYLSRTNSLEEREHHFPLRGYAWDLWALHAVASTADTTIETLSRAQELYDEVAFGSGYEVPKEFQRIVEWADRECPLLDCLRNPYFFEEYTAPDLGGRIYRHAFDDEFRLLHLVPNQNRIAGVRCSVLYTSLNSPQPYEAVSIGRETDIGRKYIWLNGNRIEVPANRLAGLRAIRDSSPQSLPVWMDFDWTETGALSMYACRSKIFASAASVTVCLEETSENEIWALEIMRLTAQLLERRSDHIFNDLADLLRSRQSTDPFILLKSLFQRPWWEESWIFPEVILGKDSVLLYGNHALPFATLQNFVSLAAQAFRLISDASPNHGHDPAVLVDSTHWENVLGLVRMRAQSLCDNKSTNPILQLLYASRYCTPPEDGMHDRLHSLRSLMPPDAPNFSYMLSPTQEVIYFCYHTVLLMNNLDLFTIFSPEKQESCDITQGLPSWADFCMSSSTMAVMRPLLLRELITGADGPFCAGGRQFRQAPALSNYEYTLHPEGFLIDTLESQRWDRKGYDDEFSRLLLDALEAMRDHSPSFQDDQSQLDRKGYGEFSRRRRWFRTTSGRAVLGPERARAGDRLTILIGGKTPFLLRHLVGEELVLVGEWYVWFDCI
jgi:hypothetical protein